LEDKENIFWFQVEGEKKLATKNLIPGNQVYNERLLVVNNLEYRTWNPFRSKLAAAIMNGLNDFPFNQKSDVLYLGVSTGTTISHISDIVGQNGTIFGIEHTSRVARDFLDRVALHRKNIVPIIHDARKPEEFFSVYKKVDVVYVDIAQPDQTNIAIENCKLYLKSRGYLFLIIKTRSIDVIKDPKIVIKNEIKKLEQFFQIKQIIDLEPYDKDHVIVIATFLE
tara:strand:- start:109 stop:780 length:672 start_codon:yes stop_codon:yes gene_type:complete